MAIVMQYDKRSGITYAYESHFHWGSAKRKAGAKRTLIGQLDRATGAIIPLRGQSAEAQKTEETIVKESVVNEAAVNETAIREMGVEMDAKKAAVNETTVTETAVETAVLPESTVIKTVTAVPRTATNDTTDTSRRIRDIRLACEKLMKRSESQQKLAETLRSQVEALNEPLKDLKFHLERFQKTEL